MTDRTASPIDFDPTFSFNASSYATRDSDSEIDPLTGIMSELPPWSYSETEGPKPLVPFTVSSALPMCDYKEEWEPKERRTDAYLSVQIQILKYLDTHAADELRAAQASFFVENTGTKPYGPTAKQAVELCYFMRSWGFDVYAKLKPKADKVQLFLAHPQKVGKEFDHLFWEQNIKTGEIVPLSEIAVRHDARRSALRQRRPGMADIFSTTERQLQEAERLSAMDDRIFEGATTTAEMLAIMSYRAYEEAVAASGLSEM